jgi:hypothetical protein
MKRLALSALCACGTSTGTGTVVGTAKGQAFDVHDAISAQVRVSETSANAHVAMVLMGNASGLCDDVTNGTQTKSFVGVQLTMFVADITGVIVPPSPGDFTIGAACGNAASWATIVTDATCTELTASEAMATSGTVTLTKISGNVFDGTYDVTLDSGDHVTGKFSPVGCGGLQTRVDATTPPTCM